MPWEEQVITILQQGYLDGFPVSEIQRFEEDSYPWWNQALWTDEADSGDLSIDDSSSKLVSVLDE